MIKNMTFTQIAKTWWVCWQVTFWRAAWEEDDDNQEEGWKCGGRHSENGGGSGHGEATGQQKAMLTATTIPLISETRWTPIG
jgi:hypothetical protein